MIERMGTETYREVPSELLRVEVSLRAPSVRDRLRCWWYGHAETFRALDCDAEINICKRCMREVSTPHPPKDEK